MPYDEQLADRIRAILAERGVATVEKKAFGGLAFLANGNMACAAGSNGDLLLRCDPADTDAHAEHPGVGRYVMRGREMNGWLNVSGTALADLGRWVDVGVAYAATLPPK